MVVDTIGGGDSVQRVLPFISIASFQRMAQVIICRAPSFPRTPGSCGLGLLSRPFFRLKKESMPLFPFPFASGLSTPSAGKVDLWSASSLQLPASSSTICTPPPLLVLRVAPRGRWGCCCWAGNGRWKEGAPCVLGDGGRLVGASGGSSRVSPTVVIASGCVTRLADPSFCEGGEPPEASGCDSCRECVVPARGRHSSGFLE